MKTKFTISKKTSLKGDDGYKTFSIRIKKETSDKLDELSVKTGHSRNALIGSLLEIALSNIEIQDEQTV
jgi:predicted DNA-binding protein